MRTLHICTRAFRYQNLPHVAASIEAGLTGLDYRWWVSFNPAHGLPELPPWAIPVAAAGSLPYGLDGLREIVSRIESGWFYGLDDDNAVHPRLGDALAHAGPRGVMMPQELGGGRVRELCDVPRVCEIDLAQYVLDRPAVGDWHPADAQADGRLIETAYGGGGIGRVPFPASYYNYLTAFPRPWWWEDRAEEIYGWFDYAPLYDAAVRAARPGGVLVELGCYLGKSTVHLGRAAKAAGKQLRVVAIDAWDDEWYAAVARHHPLPVTTGVYAAFLTNVRRAGLDGIVTPVRADATAAAALFADGSVDFVFVDADHSRAAVAGDLAAWLPKVRPGGTLAGHDYRNPDFPGVAEAVDAFAVRTRLAVWTEGSCFAITVPGDE